MHHNQMGYARLFQLWKFSQCNTLHQQVKGENHMILSVDVEQASVDTWQNLKCILDKNCQQIMKSLKFTKNIDQKRKKERRDS